MLSGLKGITRSFRPSPPLGRGSREGGPGHRAGAGGRGECGAAPRGPVWYLEISSIWFVCPSASSLSICEVTVSPCQGHVPSGLKLDGRNREELFVGIGCTGDPGTRSRAPAHGEPGRKAGDGKRASLGASCKNCCRVTSCGLGAAGRLLSITSPLSLPVCVSYLGRFYQDLKDRDVTFSPASIEKELINFCREARGKENRLVSSW